MDDVAMRCLPGVLLGMDGMGICELLRRRRHELLLKMRIPLF